MKDKIINALIAIAVITFGIITTVKIDRLESKMEHQEAVSQQIYNDLHQHTHQADSLWIYEDR